MRGIIPVALVGSLFPGLRTVVDYRCALSALAIDDVEVGAIVRDGGPGVAPHRADEDSVRVLQIIQPKVAWEAKEGPVRSILRQSREIRNYLGVGEACYSL